MLMTPMTPKVMARPMATSTSTEPRLNPKTASRRPSRFRGCRCVRRPRRRPPDARPARRTSRPEPARQAGQPVAHLRAEAAASVSTAASRARIGPSRSASARPVSISCGPRRQSPRPRAPEHLNGRFVERTYHRVDRRQPDGRIGIAEPEPRERGPQHAPQAVVGADLGERRSGGAGGACVRGSISLLAGRLSSAVFDDARCASAVRT